MVLNIVMHLHDRRRSLIGLTVALVLLLSVGRASALADPLPPTYLDAVPVAASPIAKAPAATPIPRPMTPAELDAIYPRVVIGAPGTPAPKSTPRPRASGNGHSLRGKASWYCKAGVSPCMRGHPAGEMDAAACGPLRAAMGSGWRGRIVTVTGNGHTIQVKLVDWCGSTDKTIDLYAAPFSRLAPTSAGVVRVTVIW